MTEQETYDALCGQIYQDLAKLQDLTEATRAGDPDAVTRSAQLMNASEVRFIFAQALEEVDVSGVHSAR